LAERTRGQRIGFDTERKQPRLEIRIGDAGHDGCGPLAYFVVQISGTSVWAGRTHHLPAVIMV